MRFMVILVTGSRHLTDDVRVFKALDALSKPYADCHITVRHGGASGADMLAAKWAKARGYEEERVCADWNAYGKAAGPIRNQRMVDMDPRPAVCVGFPEPDSRGTYDCMDRARKAGITVVKA